jgi:hypothetical protein
MLFIKHAALPELDQIPPIDHIGRFDRFCARILRRNFVERCLQSRLGDI